MITTNWSEAAAIFDAVVDLDAAGRESYLAAACAGNPELRKDVEAMLAADADASGFLSHPILRGRLVQRAEFEPSDRVGPYEILGMAGRGGMGAVYLARRVEDFERRVAIKIIDRLVPDRATFRRFLRERQILSSLDHPNIAKLFDGGVTESGMPFLVMEYVEGLPIDEYCRTKALPLKDRLRLFLQVCDAVAHAHRHLVVHSDIKPANILVTNDGFTKLVDFGIARNLVATQGTAATTGMIVATPGFACPEQMAGGRISTSWDVYSLGKVLELISAEAPSDFRSPDIRKWNSWVYQARLRHDEMIRDVLSIVAKSVERQETKRYPSAQSLVIEVRAALEGRVVSARRLAGFAALTSQLRRNLTKFIAFCLLVVAILTGIRLAYTGRQAMLNREIVAKGLSSYLLSLFQVIDPDLRSDRSISALEVLDQGTSQARANLPLDSPEYIQMIREIGGLYAKIGAYRQAQNLLSEAVATSRGMDPILVAGIHLELARVLHTQGSNSDAEIHLRKSLELLESPNEITAEVYGNVLEEFVSLYVDRNRLSLADSMANLCLEIRTRWPSEPNLDVASAKRLMADISWRARDFKKAEEIYLDVLSAERAVLGPRSLRLASTLNMLGLVYVDMGDLDRAEFLLRESLSIKKAILGSDHPSYATSLANFAPIVGEKFGVDSASALMKEVVSIFTGKFGSNHQEVATARNNLANYLDEVGLSIEAQNEYRAALDIWRRVVGVRHPDYLAGVQNLAISLRLGGNHVEAVRYYNEAVQGFRHLGPNYRTTLAGALNGLGKSQRSIGDLAGAAASFRESLEIREAELPAGHWRIGTARSMLGETLAEMGNRNEAEHLLQSGLQILTAARGSNDEKTLEAEERLRRFTSAPVARAS